jgi:hypothetical protein
MKSRPSPPTPAARYARIARAFAVDPAVEFGAGRKRGFGAGALAVRGRIFAMLASRGRFVVKLPAPRVATLTAAGRGRPFVPGPGRVMKEWLEVAAGDKGWLALAREARAFVGGAP